MVPEFAFCGDRLRAVRTDAGLSQHKLAIVVGTHGNTICTYENGRAVPTVRILAKLAWALDVQVDTFIVAVDDL